MAAPDFWNDQNAAKAVIDQANAQRAVLNPFKTVSGRLEDIRILVELAGGLRAVRRGGVEVRGARRLPRLGARRARAQPAGADQFL